MRINEIILEQQLDESWKDAVIAGALGSAIASGGEYQYRHAHPEQFKPVKPEETIATYNTLENVTADRMYANPQLTARIASDDAEKIKGMVDYLNTADQVQRTRIPSFEIASQITGEPYVSKILTAMHSDRKPNLSKYNYWYSRCHDYYDKNIGLGSPEAANEWWEDLAQKIITLNQQLKDASEKLEQANNQPVNENKELDNNVINKAKQTLSMAKNIPFVNNIIPYISKHDAEIKSMFDKKINGPADFIKQITKISSKIARELPDPLVKNIKQSKTKVAENDEKEEKMAKYLDAVNKWEAKQHKLSISPSEFDRSNAWSSTRPPTYDQANASGFVDLIGNILHLPVTFLTTGLAGLSMLSVIIWLIVGWLYPHWLLVHGQLDWSKSLLRYLTYYAIAIDIFILIKAGRLINWIKNR